jgi:DNA polymerase I-like protein with 3'-5' exonuclease and polymerase domains
MKILILDCETTVNNVGEGGVGKFKASPFHKDNYIVEYGVKRLGEEKTYTDRLQAYTATHFMAPVSSPGGVEDLQDIMLVGHNIKFDLLYMMKESIMFREIFEKIKIWDTMLAEYLITGQVEQYASLDKCAAKYGGVLKDDKIKAYWDAGVGTEDIPPNELHEYLIGDVNNTEIVFTKQMELIQTLGLLPLVKTQMAGLQATVEMEWNGMHFDKARAVALGRETKTEMETKLKRIKHLMHVDTCYTPYFLQEIFNINSTSDLATALCGGAFEYDIKVDELDANGLPKRFKSGVRKGEVRQIKKTRYLVTEGFGVVPDPAWKTPSGKMGTSSSVLKDIAKRTSRMEVKEFCNLVLEYRALGKDLNTYYIGYSDLTWEDECIHPTLSHVGTDTGRLSCSKPNLQNATQTEDY